MTKMPTEVEISPELALRLRELGTKEQGLQTFVKMVTEEAERKMAVHRSEVQKVWAQIQKETGIDMESIMWMPHPTDNKIVPVQMRLK